MLQLKVPRALLSATVCAVLSACGGDASNGTAGVPARESLGADGGHIHGLGIDPDDGALFIATHSGMFRAASGQDRAAPVGDRRQDTMGFSVAPDGSFLGSGHPDARDNLPPLLGLIRSEDRGRSWTPISLLGEADFHVLRNTGSRIYGFDATQGRLMVSTDAGKTWQSHTPPAPLFDLAIDPEDPGVLVASTEKGIATSANGGRSWRIVDRSRAGLLSRLDGALVLVDGEGVVQESEDRGRTWTRVGQVGGRPAAFMSSGKELLLALHTSAILQSSDGGRTWRPRVSV